MTASSAGWDEQGGASLSATAALSSALPRDFPPIYYAGQTKGDPPGTTECEAPIHRSGSSQFATGSRWGDYRQRGHGRRRRLHVLVHERALPAWWP